MKFNKLLFGLAGFPLLLASCNSAISFDQAKNWVSEHYGNETKEERAIPVVSWDFHSTTGSKDTFEYVYKIIKEINDEARIEFDMEEEDNLIPAHPDETRGQEVRVDYLQKTLSLNSGNFEKYSDEEKDDTYKINGGTFSVTYSTKVDSIEPDIDPETKEPVYTYNTCIRSYNSEGFCSDFGYKVSKRFNKDNMLKLKILVHLIYSSDPIN